MNCADFRELIEPCAAGELTPTAEMSAHVNSCVRCAAELAVARQIHDALASSEPLRAPRHFTANVLRALPARQREAPDVFEVWLDTPTLTSVAAIVLGLWLLIDTSAMARLTEQVESISSTLRNITLLRGQVFTGYAVAASIVATFVAWALVEEG
jgi:anti-sigma factor RsiW